MKLSAHETPTDRPLTPLQIKLQQRQEFYPRSRQRKRPFLVAGLHGKHLQPTPFPRGQHRRTHASANRSAARRLALPANHFFSSRELRLAHDHRKIQIRIRSRLPARARAERHHSLQLRVGAQPHQGLCTPLGVEPWPEIQLRPQWLWREPGDGRRHERRGGGRRCGGRRGDHGQTLPPLFRQKGAPVQPAEPLGHPRHAALPGLPITLPRSDRFLLSLTPPRSETASRCRRRDRSPSGPAAPGGA